MTLLASCFNRTLLVLFLFFGLFGNAQKLKITEIEGLDTTLKYFNVSRINDNLIVLKGEAKCLRSSFPKHYYLYDIKQSKAKAINYVKDYSFDDKVEKFFEFNGSLYCIKTKFNVDEKNYQIEIVDLKTESVLKKITSEKIGKGQRADFSVNIAGSSFIVFQSLSLLHKSTQIHLSIPQKKLIAYEFNEKLDLVKTYNLDIEIGKDNAYFSFLTKKNNALSFVYVIENIKMTGTFYTLACVGINSAGEMNVSKLELGTQTWHPSANINGKEVSGFFAFTPDINGKGLRFPSKLNYYEFDSNNGSIVLKQENAMNIKDKLTDSGFSGIKTSSYRMLTDKNGGYEFCFEFVKTYIASPGADFASEKEGEQSEIWIIKVNSDGKVVGDFVDKRSVP